MVAASVAGLGNRALFGRSGRGAIFVGIPWWEETCKLGAILVAPELPVLSVHVLFGLLECIENLRHTRPDGVFLGVLALSGHGLAGGVAALALQHLGGLGWAYAAAGVIHMIHSLVLIRLVLPTLGAGAYAGSEEG